MAASTQVIDASIGIEAPPVAVWRALTDVTLAKQWMAEPEMQLEIVTDWRVGSPVIVRGRHHVDFENRGTVLRFEPASILQYTHLSSISRLPDKPENYALIEFRLWPTGPHSTSLNVRVSNFASESIFRHFDFYWRITLPMIKRFVEKATDCAG